MHKRSIIQPFTSYTSLITNSPEEAHYFEWYTCRTVKKIPGAFVSTFWDTLLFQASQTEPAIWHAVLTLSAVHRRDIFDDCSPNPRQSASVDVPESQEQFMLQQYIHSIRHLKPHFSSKDKDSIRVALITCVVFVCLEFLRGHFATAQTHLENGLKVLGESHMLCTRDDGGFLHGEPTCDSMDGWIIEALSRLQFQVELFRLTYQHPHPPFILHSHTPQSAITTFHSVNEAWKHLQYIFTQIFHLTEDARQRQHSGTSSNPPIGLLHRQHELQNQLVQWLTIFSTSTATLSTHSHPHAPHNLTPNLQRFVRHLLHEYHSLATILLSTSLSSNQSIYDSPTIIQHFLSILHHSTSMWRTSTISPSRPRALPGLQIDMSHSLVDIGWIPPLYNTAIKCRIWRIRMHAIRLLESTSHRELCWDSRVVASVARRVVQIEEEGARYHKDEAFDLNVIPIVEDLEMEGGIPEENRVLELKVGLVDGMTDSVVLSYRRRRDEGVWRDVGVYVKSRG